MRILVAYDASPGAEDALSDLALAGLPRDAEVLVVAVHEPHGPVIGGASSAASFGAGTHRDRGKLATDAARTIAGRGDGRLRAAHPGWRIAHEAATGDPGVVLADRAAAWTADLVVVGSHTARRGEAEIPFGSVARRAVAGSPCSVRVARLRPVRPVGRPLRAIVAYDGSPGADAAVAAAAGRVWPAGSRARVLVVVDPLDQSDAGESEVPWRRLREQADAAAAVLRAGGIDPRADVVTGSARQRIPEECASWDADVLFVGARGEHGPAKPLAGSVATAAVAAAPCTVEVVRAPRAA